MEEVADSDLIVHVVDGSHPDPREQIRSVREVIREIGGGENLEIIAINKADAAPQEVLMQLLREEPNSYAISANIEKPDDISDFDSSPTDDVREAGSVLAETLIEEGKDVDQEQVIRGLSIVANIDRIADSLDQNSPAIKDVITPDETAKDRVLQVSPIDQTTGLWKRVKKSLRKYL